MKLKEWWDLKAVNLDALMLCHWTAWWWHVVMCLRRRRMVWYRTSRLLRARRPRCSLAAVGCATLYGGETKVDNAHTKWFFKPGGILLINIYMMTYPPHETVRRLDAKPKFQIPSGWPAQKSLRTLLYKLGPSENPSHPTFTLTKRLGSKYENWELRRHTNCIEQHSSGAQWSRYRYHRASRSQSKYLTPPVARCVELPGWRQ